MQNFVHLHVHTQYSILDGQASIPGLVDKAMKDGMPGIAVTDHGNMFGIKEFYNYVTKKNSGKKGEIKTQKKRLNDLKSGKVECDDVDAAVKACEEEIERLQASLFKPIIGCEVYVARRGMAQKSTKEDQGGWHLILLAKNEKGYHNLIKIVSRAWTAGYYYRPRTDHDDLVKYHEGLIAASACLGGEVPRKIMAGDLEEAEKSVLWFKELFGDDYYIELQRHKATAARANYETYPKQQEVNKHLIDFARKHHIKLICTNDVHFVEEENAEAHDRLICLSTSRDLDDPTRMLYSKQEWMKTTDEMAVLFDDIPEALSNTMEVYDKVEFYSIDHAPIMPNFNIPEEFGTEEGYRQTYSEKDLFDEFTQDENGNVVLSEEAANEKIEKLGGYDKLYRIKLEADYLKKLTFDGAKLRYGEELNDEVKERLKFELHIMKTMGFPGYFLIVQDFIRAAREELNVSVGPGRGSAAGSAVAYCLGITKIDPIEYDLLFERFLNPDRISLPDIDVDFDDDGRGRVLNWVTEKYGQEKVAHIITYGTMATKLAIKDVARVEKVPLTESERLTKLIPDRLPEKDGKAQKINLKNCIANVEELQMACNSDDEHIRNTMKYAQMLEGNVRNTGVHACGTIICRDDITDWVPVSTADDKETGEKMLVTQYEGSVIEDTGLIKMDFLGLKTLSIIKEALENIRLHRGLEIDIDSIDLNDEATYKLYSEGRTIGTFQFESPGMQKYLKELHPSTFEDLIAMNALYRPGPMDYIPDFIDRKHGRKAIEYDIPVMEKYLKDTYGITVYQEQVMLLSRLLADFTRGESDALRKAMGKKLKDKLDHMKPKFIEGGKKNGHDPQILEKIWGDWEKFASYAFNKSHATCYSWVAYQTAYLKANYPSEYMAAILSRNLSNIADITRFIDECKAMGIQVLGPDINESSMKFTVNQNGDIRFGLCAIKGVGEGAIQHVLQEREKEGPFRSIFDFVQRISFSACNRKNIESMVQAGVFDMFKDIEREQYFATNQKGETFLDSLLRYGNKYQLDKASTVNSLFGAANSVAIALPEIPERTGYSLMERLNKERELVGIYLSAHPLDQYYVKLNYYCNMPLKKFTEEKDSLGNVDLVMGGFVESAREGISRAGNPYGVLKLEDYSGSAEFPLFGQNYLNYRNFLKKGLLLVIKGKMTPRRYKENEFEFTFSSIEGIDTISDSVIERLTVSIPLEELNDVFINEFATFTDEKAENNVTTLHVNLIDTDTNHHVQMVADKKISVTRGLIEFLRSNERLSCKINDIPIRAN